MIDHSVVTREEWMAARINLLAREKEVTRLRDQVSQERRELPDDLLQRGAGGGGSGSWSGSEPRWDPGSGHVTSRRRLETVPTAWPHKNPIRNAPLLYNVWMSRAVGMATSMADWMMHAGLYGRFTALAEIVWMMLITRAARGRRHRRELDAA